MESSTGQDQISGRRLRRMFDQTLCNQMERLIGTSHAIGDLQLTIASIACLALVAEREKEVVDAELESNGRFTRDKLIDALAETGLDRGEDLDRAVNELIEKGYVALDSEGRMVAQKSAISMVLLFDRVFPKLPGMNLVAYFIQVMDEVASGRKDLVAAVDQLQQTLQIHGVVIGRGAESAQGSAQSKPISRQTAEQVLSKALKERQAKKRLRKVDAENVKPVIVAPGGYVREVVSTWDPSMAEADSDHSVGNTSSIDLPEEQPAELSSALSDLCGQEEAKLASSSVSGSLEEGPSSPSSLTENNERVPAAGLDDWSAEDPAAEAGGLAPLEDDACDDDIETRIEALESSLAMTCPLCNKGKVRAQTTAKGKAFYSCSNRECIFVSWGRPYYLSCPWCKNPFLIEVDGRGGSPFLRCPRATCRYQQPIPGEVSSVSNEGSPIPGGSEVKKPVRRVVRRRRVRRKT